MAIIQRNQSEVEVRLRLKLAVYITARFVLEYKALNIILPIVVIFLQVVVLIFFNYR